MAITGSLRDSGLGSPIVSIGKTTTLVSLQAEKHDGFTRNLEKSVSSMKMSSSSGEHMARGLHPEELALLHWLTAVRVVEGKNWTDHSSTAGSSGKQLKMLFMTVSRVRTAVSAETTWTPLHATFWEKDTCAWVSNFAVFFILGHVDCYLRTVLFSTSSPNYSWIYGIKA